LNNLPLGIICRIIDIKDMFPLNQVYHLINYIQMSQSQNFSEIEPQNRRFLAKAKIADLPDDTSELVYSLLDITPGQAEEGDIRILDENVEDHLLLLHYLTPTPDTYHVRGIIIDTENKCIVCQSFPYTEEVQEVDIDSKLKLTPHTNVSVAYEGTIIRLFKGKHTGTWYLSTHHRIDGRNSKWSGRAFGELWDELWKEEDYLLINQDITHAFLLAHAENKIVCTIPEPTLYLVGTFQPSDSPINIPSYVKVIETIPDVKTIDDVKRCILELDEAVSSGLILTDNSTSPPSYIKLSPTIYTAKRQIRGNHANLNLRYLQLRETGSQDELRMLFPDKEESFNALELNFEKLSSHLAEFYVFRYVNKNYYRLPKEEHFILEATKMNYNNNLELELNVKEQLKSSNARQLNAMIKRMLYRIKVNSRII
jgi:hypothetical protein